MFLGTLKQLVFAAFLYSGYPVLRDYFRGLFGKAPVTVLCYHRLGRRGVLSKTPDQFARDLEYLKRTYECITLSEYCDRIRAGKEFRRPCIVVTFDDGYRDNFTHAVPILRRYGVPATFFVSTGFVGTNRHFMHDQGGLSEVEKRYGSQPDFEKLSWNDLRQMQAEGFEIASHTMSHADLSRENASRVNDEVRESLAMLQRELGERPRPFAYPWGTAAHASDVAVEAVRRAGYYAAVTMLPGTNQPGQDLYRIHRTDAGNGNMSWLAFKARIAGLKLGLGNPRYVAPGESSVHVGVAGN